MKNHTNSLHVKKFYVTTPIYYINDIAHIGHAYATIAADTIARHYRNTLGKENVLFLTGTDENSQKTIDAATKNGMELEEYTDVTAQKWRNNWDTLGISYNDFIRTTDKKHAKVVQDILQKVYDAGDIYKGTYEGLYCVGHEAFMKEEDLVDGLCPDHKKAPDFIKEENWFFRLSKYQERLLEYIEANPEFIQPESRRNEILAFIRTKGLEDFSISRQSQSWGIRLPFDDTQVAYVWFDALLNYVTAAGYGNDTEFAKWWPADLHIVGKDIIKFHCIYWPAMLWSAELALPKQIFAHGFFTADGTKISKSLGNAIDPIPLVEKYGNDALRYYLLREITFGGDGDFSHARLDAVYHSDLANNLGNLVSRVAAMLTRYNNGNIENTAVTTSLNVDKYIEKLEFHKALKEIFAVYSSLNLRIEDEKPWQGIKLQPEKTILSISEMAAVLLDSANALRPFLPETSARIEQIFANNKVDISAGVLFAKIVE